MEIKELREKLLMVFVNSLVLKKVILKIPDK
jgi:hypothetical protein